MPSENTQQDGNTQQGRGTQQGGELERRKNKVFLCHTRALAQALATQSTVRCSLTSKQMQKFMQYPDSLRTICMP